VGDFREAMSRVPSGLAAITAADPSGAPCGLLVSSISSYSVSPPSVMAAIARGSRSYRAIANAEAFGVHVLRSDQEPVAQQFASALDDKFEGLRWRWERNIPRLLEALIYLPCRRRAMIPHGDHAIVVGEALAVVCDPGEPLIYLRRQMDWRPARR
jgi:flavin reductase (DIM6/NTAB) family NADH-FMN oxidoreductase RutF